MGSDKRLVVYDVGTDIEEIAVAHLQRTEQRCSVCMRT